MKIKSYHILFHLLSYLADKTNGAPILVKYKLLLGTLIISVASSSANTLSKVKPVNDSIPLIDHAEITCYKPAIIRPDSLQKVVLKRRVEDESGEPAIGASVTIKGKHPLGVLTGIDGNFTLEVAKTDIVVFTYIGFNTQEISVSDILGTNKPIVMKESDMISCYEVVIVPASYKDDIYTRTSRITNLSYDRIQTPPVSPVGDLSKFKNWMDRNVSYNETMLKEKVEGDVILSFTIDKKGEITHKKVIGKLSPDADTEALRVLSSSERWTPGKQNGKKIKTTLTVEVNFKMPK